MLNSALGIPWHVVVFISMPFSYGLLKNSNFSIVAGKLKKRKVPFWLLKVHSKSKIQKLPADIEKLRKTHINVSLSESYPDLLLIRLLLSYSN